MLLKCKHQDLKKKANHEEGDPRFALHVIHCHADSIIIAARDTNVVLMLAHTSKIIENLDESRKCQE